MPLQSIDRIFKPLFSCFLFIPVLIWAQPLNKINPGFKKTQSVPYDSAIIDIGALKNFVANNTENFAFNYDPESFRIGRDDLEYPSMMWRDALRLETSPSASRRIFLY